MPAEVIREPLALKLSLPGQATELIAIGDLPNLLLATDLTEGLAALIHPNGPLAKRTTVMSFTYTLRRMVRELRADGFVGSAGELTRPLLASFWLRSQYLVEYRTRAVLRAFDERHQALAEPVRQMVFGTNYTRPVVGSPLPPYQPAEWNRLIDLCKAEVRRLGDRHRAMLALAEEGTDPAVGGWDKANAAWLLLRLGPVSRAVVAKHLGLTREEARQGSLGLEEIRNALFPTHADAVPYLLLLGAWTGIVPDGLTTGPFKHSASSKTASCQPVPARTLSWLPSARSRTNSKGTSPARPRWSPTDRSNCCSRRRPQSCTCPPRTTAGSRTRPKPCVSSWLAPSRRRLR
ncbi:hypothetical protein OG729_39330 [Streptomyces sp. NBC_00210]|uniref:hypothetical protein n=1 Tax=Streptomyces sp. NBC_00210 TaxID=2903636 RepID=UPI0032566558